MTHPYSWAYKNMFFIFVIMIYRCFIFSSVYVSWNDTLPYLWCQIAVAFTVFCLLYSLIVKNTKVNEQKTTSISIPKISTDNSYIFPTIVSSCQSSAPCSWILDRIHSSMYLQKAGSAKWYICSFTLHDLVYSFLLAYRTVSSAIKLIFRVSHILLTCFTSLLASIIKETMDIMVILYEVNVQ